MTYGIGVLIYFIGVGLTFGVLAAIDEPDDISVIQAVLWPFSVVVGVGYLLGRLFRRAK